VAVTVLATDTIAAIAAKINGANAGVVATVFNDGANERLLLSSKTTGEAAGFRVQASDSLGDPITTNTGLGQLAFDPETGAFGMASATIPVQYGQDAKARINGLAVSSATNTLTDNIPGVTIKLLATTTTGYGSGSEVKSPLTMGISEDVTPAVKNVSDFVTAYNKLNKSLADLTKYDAATKTAGLFQGDSSVVGLQNILRNMLGSASLGATSQRLSDVGVERQLDGSLTINTPKLSAAANNGTTLQQLFTTNNNNPLTNGFALKFRDLGKGVLASGGSVFSKAAALQKNLATNTTEQTRVNDRTALFETRLRKQYSALDAQMASLNALNAYVTNQVAAWNKSTA
jgi:flagellar hook-associated protein 2